MPVGVMKPPPDEAARRARILHAETDGTACPAGIASDEPAVVSACAGTVASLPVTALANMTAGIAKPVTAATAAKPASPRRPLRIFLNLPTH